MMIMSSMEARRITDNVNESKKFREYMKSLNHAEQQKMHNIFNNVKKSSMQGDNSILIDTAYFTESMLDLVNFLGYTIVNSELSW